MGCILDVKESHPIPGVGVAMFRLTCWTGEEELRCNMEVDDGVMVTSYERSFPWDKWNDIHYDRFVAKFCRDAAYRENFRIPVENPTCPAARTLQVEEGTATITSYLLGPKLACEAVLPTRTLWGIVPGETAFAHVGRSWGKEALPGVSDTELVLLAECHLQAGLQVVCVKKDTRHSLHIDGRWVTINDSDDTPNYYLEFSTLPEPFLTTANTLMPQGVRIFSAYREWGPRLVPTAKGMGGRRRFVENATRLLDFYRDAKVALR